MTPPTWRTRSGFPPLPPDIWDSPDDRKLPAEVPPDPTIKPAPALPIDPAPVPPAGDVLHDEGEDDRSSPDEPIPARMLNEFVYCPRLFYYEHVDGVFVASGDTERGKSLHRRVDKGKGDLKPAAKKSPSAASGESPATSASSPDDPASGPPPKHDIIHSRSAMLGSDRLGAVAKMDLIEVEMVPVPPPPPADPPPVQPDLFSQPPAATPAVRPREVGRVTPVDYKLGSPRTGDDGNELWDADRMQLGVQILILRDNGYRCDGGVIYYNATKQRVPLPMTPELEDWIVDRIAAARAVTRGPIPPPLADSPKCVRCSLAPVCLPDETRFLARAAGTDDSPAAPTSPDRPPRRLIAPRDDARALYLNSQGTKVGLRGEVLVVKDDKSTAGEFRTQDVHHVSLFGNIQISARAIQWLCTAEIPVFHFSMSGWFYGVTRGHGLKNVFTRIAQFRAAADPAVSLAVARKFVFGKIRNHRTQLMRNHIALPGGVALKLKRAALDALNAPDVASLLGIEGAAAALYFRHLSGLVKVRQDDDELPGLSPEPTSDDSEAFTFDFSRRSRRPPVDPVNALLSLAYSLLVKDCTLAALSAGFDPYVGFFHQPRHGRPALALDLMEEFRPLVADSAVLSAINNRMIVPSHFVRAGNAVNLNAHGRKAFFLAYEQRMNSLVTHPVFDYKVSYRRILELQARMLARFLTGEIPEYIPMMTR